LSQIATVTKGIVALNDEWNCPCHLEQLKVDAHDPSISPGPIPFTYGILHRANGIMSKQTEVSIQQVALGILSNKCVLATGKRQVWPSFALQLFDSENNPDVAEVELIVVVSATRGDLVCNPRHDFLCRG
jgi:hypothetical protein